MFIKRNLRIFLVASIVILALGFSPRVNNSARAIPLDQDEVTIPYSGSLTDEAGQPVVDGVYDFVFKLYQAERGGEALWTESVAGVPIKDGNFTVLLGSVNPLPKDVLEGGARWLEIGVLGPGETDFTMLAPRQELSSSALKTPASPSAGSACAHDHWGEYWSGSGVGLHLYGTNDTPLWAESNGGFAGVDGRNTTGIGVWGESNSKIGVFGKATTTTSPATGVWGEVYSSSTLLNTAAGVMGVAHKTTGLNYGVFGSSASSDGIGVLGNTLNTACTPIKCQGVYGFSYSGTGVYGETETGVGVQARTLGNGTGLSILNQGSGNLIVAATFAGDRFKVDNSGNVYADGSYTGAGGVFIGSADFAEMMLPAKMDLEPGDVLAVDLNGKMVRSTASYQATVVGVYSTDPGFVAGNKLDENGNPLEPDRIPLAVIGVVPVKVSAENGAIHPGDLLVASSTPGHAMKAGSDPAVGTVIGKALGLLESGTGVIQMLVMLQ